MSMVLPDRIEPPPYQGSGLAKNSMKSVPVRRDLPDSSKGEPSAAAIDRGWPHQVVLPARLSERDGYNEIHDFCRDLTLCTRGHALYHDGRWFHVYCFKELADAQKFLERFGGERFDPMERGRGANWAAWEKG
jgi:hypothetical protein